MLSKDKKDLIVVPYDFTEAAETALSHATEIAKAGHDEVRLLHIINRETKSKLKKENASEDAIYERLKEISEKNQADSGVVTSYHAAEGSIFTTIGEYVSDAQGALLVMGTHGVRGMQHIVGAYSLKVVTSSDVPVIITQKRKMAEDGYKKIILPIDNQKHGKNKVMYAIAIAKYFDAELHLFSEHYSDEFLARQVMLNHSHAVSNLNKNNVKFVEASENPKESGGFAKQLIRYAAQNDGDLIVISSQHDTNGVADLIIGNNEEQIINNDAQIPVMCVNPMQDTSHIGNVIFL